MPNKPELILDYAVECIVPGCGLVVRQKYTAMCDQHLRADEFDRKLREENREKLNKEIYEGKKLPNHVQSLAKSKI